MNAFNPSLFRSLLASIRALPGSEQLLLEQVVRELSERLNAEEGRSEEHRSEEHSGETVSPAERIALSPWQERRAKELMSSQMDKGVSIAQVASECSLSRSHFSRAFKKNTGLSPRDWYLQMRLEKAKGLLGDSTLTISQISLDCGFADQSHFTRVFTRVVGITPFNWRRSMAHAVAG